jgi:acyl-CoA synthetase (AMP-forming)/AMP-acid ligase II
MNLVEILKDYRKESYPAIIESKFGNINQISYSDLEQQSAKAAAYFKQTGLKEGDAVLVFYPISIQLYVIILGLFRIKCVVILIDPQGGKDYIKQCCQLYPPKGFIGSNKAILFGLLMKEIRAIPIKFSASNWIPFTHHFNRYLYAKPESDIPNTDNEFPALITFTSGSTSIPKVVVRSHGFLINQHQVLEQTLSIQKKEVVMTTLPVFVLSHLGSGATTVLPDADLTRPGFIDPKPVLNQIQELNVKSMIGSPSFFENICDECEKQGAELKTLVRLFTGGAPVFPSLLKRLNQIVPQAQLTAVYGSTEAEPISHINYTAYSNKDLEEMKSGSGLLVGLPIKDIQIQIIPNEINKEIDTVSQDTFENLCLPSKAVGEIAVSGSHVLKGYLNGVGDKASKFKVADAVWHRTGDAGFFDDHGRLWLMGRCLAKLSFNKVDLYPFSIETILSFEEEIKRSAILQFQDRLLLLIEPKNNNQNLELLRSKIEAITKPICKVDIHFVEKIPVDKRHNSKIDYVVLRKTLPVLLEKVS